MNKEQLSPSYLFVGTTESTLLEAYAFIQETFCPETCGTCSSCTQIVRGEHHSFIHIIPEKRYTLDTLEPIFKRISFSLDDEEHCFFIIHKADFLTIACANSMLKIVEEPPPGYHFIFLAQRLQQMLPTIRSRSIVKLFQQYQGAEELPPLLQEFMSMISNPINFQKVLNESAITEQESMLLVDQLLGHWITIYKRSVKNNNETHIKKAVRMIDILKKTVLTPPMPGSSKLFWKNLYLQK